MFRFEKIKRKFSLNILKFIPKMFETKQFERLEKFKLYFL